MDGLRKNFTIEYRFGEQKQLERMPELAAELVRLKVDLIVASGGTPSSLAAKSATTNIPIVMTNPWGSRGFRLGCQSGAAGGNVTGLSSLSFQLNTKRLEILKARDPQP